MSLTDAAVDRAALQRRTITTLRLAQVPGQAAIAGVVAVLALFVGDLLGDDRFAGSGNAAFTLGSALMAPSFAAFSRRRGRRPALVTAFVIGACGAAVAAFGGQMRWVWLLLVGMVMFGGAQAASLQGRFVAADLAEPGEGPRAIAAVVWLGTLGAVFGPVLTPQWKRLAPHLGLDPSVGPIAFAAILSLGAAAIIWFRLRPDPLAVTGGIDPTGEPRRSRSSRCRRSWVRHPTRADGAARAGVDDHRPGGDGRSDDDDAAAHARPPSRRVVGATSSRCTSPACTAWRRGSVGSSSASVRIVPSMVAGVVLACGTAGAVLAGYHRPLIFVGLFLLGSGMEHRPDRRQLAGDELGRPSTNASSCKARPT